MNKTILSRFLLVTGILLGLRISATAQMVGLPVLDTANTRDQGSLEATPGIVIGQDMNFYGVRGTITVLDELRGFLDLGQLDIDGYGDSLAMQAGALLNLPVCEVVDTAVRGTFYYSNTDRQDIMGCNLMFLCSDESLLDNLYLYGGAGLDLSKKETYSSKSEVNPAIAMGLSYKVCENIHLFLEGDYVDGFYGSFGVSIR